MNFWNVIAISSYINYVVPGRAPFGFMAVDPSCWFEMISSHISLNNFIGFTLNPGIVVKASVYTYIICNFASLGFV